MIQRLKNIMVKKPQLLWFGALALLLSYAFFLRVINLNYNSAFIDEASSVIIGRMGVFQGDWWTYNAANWYSGHPLFEPVISSLTYVTTGIFGSRMMNVIISILTIEAVMVTTLLLVRPLSLKSYIAGGIAGFIVASSSVSLYVSRIATYDIKSFFLLFLSLLILVWTEHSTKNLGKWYFLAFGLLFLAVMAKIISLIYVPLFVIYSFWQVRKKKDKYPYWLKYFLVPVLIVIGVYLIMMASNIMSFGKLQATKETRDTLFILNRIREVIPYELALGVLGGILMLLFKQWKSLLALSLAAVWILISHIVTGRAVETMDKHVFVTVVFVSMITGIGLSNLLTKFSNTYVVSILVGLTILGFSLFGYKSYALAQQYNDSWLNITKAQNYLKGHVKTSDTILSESGEPMILALYDVNFPANTTTFNWFEYRGQSGDTAYGKAVKDGHFTWIEIMHDSFQNTENKTAIRDVIKTGLDENYTLSYTDETVEIYRRVF